MILAQYIQNIISTCDTSHISSAYGHMQLLDCAGVEWERRVVDRPTFKDGEPSSGG